MPTALLVSNRRPDEDAGRAEKIATRDRLFEQRRWTLEISYVPEPYIPTFPLAVARAVRRVRETEPDVLLSIVNPFHIHVVGYLASRITGVPWIAEFRDPILTHPDREDWSPIHRLASVAERLAVRNADRVVWLDGIQIPEGYFLETYPDVSVSRLVELPPMGYDAERFDAIDPESIESFTLTYAGSFYDGWIEPYGYLDGLAAYVDGDGSIDLQTRFYGDWRESYDRAVTERGIEQYVSVHGFVDHDRMVAILKGSDALLYVGGTDERNRRNLPSKLWDYLGARRPILVLADESFRAAQFVEDNGLGIAADPRDPTAVADALRALHTGSFVFDPDPAVFETYTRQRHADAYVAVMDDLIGESATGPQ